MNTYICTLPVLVSVYYEVTKRGQHGVYRSRLLEDFWTKNWIVDIFNALWRRKLQSLKINRLFTGGGGLSLQAAKNIIECHERLPDIFRCQHVHS